MTTTSDTQHPAPTATALLVACDIDGTLLRTGTPPTDAVRDAVAALRAAGHHIVLATGRSLVGALPVVKQLALDDVWVTASNGAVTAHVVGGHYEVTDRHDVDAKAAILAAVHEEPDIRIAAEIVGHGYRVSGRFPNDQLNGAQYVAWSREELWARPTPRVALYGLGAYRLVRPLRMLGLTAIETRSDWVDVTPPEVSKASALEKVRAALGVEEIDTAALGDGENDIEMLGWATQSIVMGHAPGHVQGVADRVTGTIDEDGAASALLSLLA